MSVIDLTTSFRGGRGSRLLFALHAGAWVDRRGRRRQVMLAADLRRAELLVSMPLTYGLGVLTIETPRIEQTLA